MSGSLPRYPQAAGACQASSWYHLGTAEPRALLPGPVTGCSSTLQDTSAKRSWAAIGPLCSMVRHFTACVLLLHVWFRPESSQ